MSAALATGNSDGSPLEGNSSDKGEAYSDAPWRSAYQFPQECHQNDPWYKYKNTRGRASGYNTANSVPAQSSYRRGASGWNTSSAKKARNSSQVRPSEEYQTKYGTRARRDTEGLTDEQKKAWEDNRARERQAMAAERAASKSPN